MAPSKNILRRLISTLAGDSPSPSRRRPRQAVPMLDRLEERVVLSHGHHVHQLATVAHVSTTTGAATTGTTTSTTTSATQDATLTADLKQFQTDLTTALAGSTVTDAQRLALNNDLMTIRQAGVTIDTTALMTVADTLLTDLANGTYDSDPATAAAVKTAFTAAFSGTGLNQTQITQAFTDFVTVARNLNITSAELTTLATDRAAIQADFTRLGITNTHGYGVSSNLDLITGRVFGHTGSCG
jgi:hypothetical protein